MASAFGLSRASRSTDNNNANPVAQSRAERALYRQQAQAQAQSNMLEYEIQKVLNGNTYFMLTDNSGQYYRLTWAV